MQIYDFDRDYKDVGVAKFTTKYFVVRNCLPNAKSDMLLSAWNPPTEWGKYATIQVYFLLSLAPFYTSKLYSVSASILYGLGTMVESHFFFVSMFVL